jgi:hypothetical protein
LASPAPSLSDDATVAPGEEAVPLPPPNPDQTSATGTMVAPSIVTGSP